MTECSLFRQHWVMTECSLFRQYWVMTECSLFRKLPSIWRNLISGSQNTTDSTEQSPWEAKSYPVSQGISSLSWNPEVLYLPQEPTIAPYPPEPQRRTSHLHNLINKIHFNIILKSVSNFSQVVSPLHYIMPYIFVATYETWSSCLLSMPVNNITHAQHFPLLIINPILDSRISRTLKPSLQ
jgi:hypothetical protein